MAPVKKRRLPVGIRYLEPFKAYKRKPIGLAIEFDDMGKGLVGWKAVECRNHQFEQSLTWWHNIPLY